jgi:suppressor of ftsI
VLVQGAKPGRYALKAFKYRGFAPLPTVDLAHLTVTGEETVPALTIPTTLPPTTRRLDDARIARRRRFVFSFGRNPNVFTALINGRQFDPHATDVAPVVGTVEEWTLINKSADDHPFHIHVNDFQVMSVNGRPYRARGLQDVVNIPAGGRVVIRNSFEDYTGHFVFHCHILGHEDAGMMKTVEVVRRGQRPTPPPMKGMARGHHGH